MPYYVWTGRGHWFVLAESTPEAGHVAMLPFIVPSETELGGRGFVCVAQMVAVDVGVVSAQSQNSPHG